MSANGLNMLLRYFVKWTEPFHTLVYCCHIDSYPGIHTENILKFFTHPLTFMQSHLMITWQAVPAVGSAATAPPSTANSLSSPINVCRNGQAWLQQCLVPGLVSLVAWSKHVLLSWWTLLCISSFLCGGGVSG